ncbi:signal peptidase II [Candidatus Persebacteraceae bacterium Df01]|jgi:signal peptidase II|uniref:Lipoprotein signal peptidase n=1 Tax=Candidatus Doriopsillibacter californiensis TaxID=2970740 RepID=A0ABT7QL60_9GAMM|nr:signal peptidase II [Candidatus Persebacteraceae bacterium Df01]
MRVWQWRAVLVVLIIVVADQWTKWLVVHSSLTQQSIELTPFLRLVYAENTGAAFSFLANVGDWGRWLLLAASFFICVILLVWLQRATRPIEITALILILGGAVGNVIDRVRQGYVVDFIDIHIGTYHWPAFNIADSAITVGAVVLVLVVFAGEKKDSE